MCRRLVSEGPDVRTALTLRCCARAHAVPLKRTYVDLFAAASALPSYASVGPLGLSRVIRGQLWYPVTQIGEIGHTLAIFSRWRGGALLLSLIHI